MGIKFFFHWYKNQFKRHMLKMSRGQNFMDINVSVDNLMIDMNGVFHNSAQKIYEYGNCKPQPRMLQHNRRKKISGLQKQIKVFEDVCRTVESLFYLVEPNKRLILCVDGPAPQSKQNQQRQRRFRSAMEKDDDESSFDSTCITPGTKFMDYLTKYIDWFLRKRISEDERWQNIEIIFSNEKAPGEGEAKCLKIGTPILLYNGMIKKVEDIQVGEKLIGDDGLPRTVLSLVSGEDEMFEIIQNNGDNYTVNRNHILSLQIADHKRIYWDNKDSAWIVGWYNRDTNRYQRKSFTGLKEGEISFVKMNENDKICIECEKSYTTGENFSKHMKKIHNIVIPKLKTFGRTKDEAHEDALKFLETIQDDNIVDISVVDYLKLPTNTQRKLYGFRCSSLSREKKDVDIDPYILGLWLGDGVSTQPIICSIDTEIVEYLEEYCVENGFELTHNDKYINYTICDKINRSSRIVSSLQKYNLIQNKHIPLDYKVNDEDTRLKVLAGIIDTYGNVTKNGRLVRIAQCLKHEQLVQDIVYLCRSLGFCTNVRKGKSTYTYENEKKSGICFNITISGDLERIPTLLPHKKCSVNPIPGENGRSIVVDKLRTSIKVKPVGKGEYYGFNLDGNQRYLLGDFTVTHNCINYIRFHGDPTDSYCIHGLDADLIMLAMGTHVPNFYILREDLYDRYNEFFCIDIGRIRSELAEMMRWESEKHVFNPEFAINDFIFLCFTVGNDFLPHIPSLEIIQNGIETILAVARDVGQYYGHITRKEGGRILFNLLPLQLFFVTIAGEEKGILEEKLSKKESYFPDLILERYARMEEGGKYNLDIEGYRETYCQEHFQVEESMEQICHKYLEGMQWVLSYYTRGVPNWNWSFTYHYAPPASVLASYVPTFVQPKYGRTTPPAPFQQLLSVLPPKSANLIPEPLNRLLLDENSPLKVFCPDTFDIDLAGKRKEWEGIVILPMVDFSVVRAAYFDTIGKLDQRELKRNMTNRSFVYLYTPQSSGMFRSYYGDIEVCKVRTMMIDL